MSYGGELRRLRESRGLSRPQLGYQIQMSEHQIRHRETDGTRITLSDVVSISRAFDMSPIELFCELLEPDGFWAHAAGVLGCSTLKARSRLTMAATDLGMPVGDVWILVVKQQIRL